MTATGRGGRDRGGDGLRDGIVGGSPHRVGGYDRVTGGQDYVADIRLDGALHAKLVTVEAPRARIVAIDASEARAVPGVVFVMTPEDLPSPMPRFGPQFRDRPVLAVGETKYHGDPVAAVAAETLDAAEEGARRVRVEFEPLPAVHSLDAALDPAAPLVQDPSLRPDDPLARSNVLREHRYGWGDVDAAAADAEIVLDGTYDFPMVTQFAIEPHAFMAAPDGDGMAIWSAIQHPNWLQRVMASLLDLPLARVRVFAPDPGGAFGGKQHAKYEPLVAFMARRASRPVRLVLTLEETFQAVRRGAARVHVRTGFHPDGTLVFRDIEGDYLIGAYADIADRTVAKGSYIGAGPYRIPAARIVARSVLSHTPPSTAFRGFGTPQQIWAVESQMNEAGRTLSIDPVELRRRNLATRGQTFIPGDTPADGLWPEVLDRAAEIIGWDTPKVTGRGRGVAVGIKSGPTTGLSYSTVRLLADGSAVVYAGTSDMGQGARTIFAQIAAHELGLPLEWVTVISGDTVVVPYDQQTSASRSSVLMGNAVLSACRDIQKKLRAMAARLESVPEADITVDSGVVRMPDREVPIRDVLVRGLGRLGGEVIGVGEARKEALADHPLGGTAAFYEFNATAVEVEVDRDAGDITITRYVTVSDVGRALNPAQVRGQDEGAAIMGLGHTLMEQLLLDDEGRIRNLGAIDYKIPTTLDLPLRIESEIVENGDGPGPYGAKGMSEGALLAVAPAVAAAVLDATGVSIRQLPLSPERVWRALREAETAATASAVNTGPARAPRGRRRLVTSVYAIDHPHGLPPESVLALIGGKAAGLGVMARDLDLPVPPGFVITTEACRAFLAEGWPDGLDDEIREAMGRVETILGRRFGDPDGPLLVSVRSGAPVSMPGMMDTLLDLGVNRATEAGLARGGGGELFARECRERLAGQFLAVVGTQPPEDPWQQLRLAVEAVFRSWKGERARAYRRREGIPDDLGTAATVQAMVFGNRDRLSGTGVLFTRNPATGERAAYGDVLFGAQGEDVVAGTHRTEPIAVLDERLPDVAEEMRGYAARLERHFADMCDIEFTIESGRLWMLQVRVGKRSPAAALRIAVEMAEDRGFPLTREAAVRRVLALLDHPPVMPVVRDRSVLPLTVGLAASPGIASGGIVTSPDEAVRMADEGQSVILVRSETSPDDVHGMAKAAGLLTSRGGIASHAAVVARGWGIPAVVGAGPVVVRERGIAVDGIELENGDPITVDGSTGAVYRGRVETTSEVVPAAATLLAWARELGIDVGNAGQRPPESARQPEAAASGEEDRAPARAAVPDEALRLIGVKGLVTLEAAGDSLGIPPETARATLDALVEEGLVIASAGAYRLSEAGTARQRELFAVDRAALGEDAAQGLLEGLLALDGRVKETVTAWQLREGVPGAEPAVNDHTDAAYDDRVLGRLSGLAAEADAWLAAASRSLPRLDGYRERLRRAVAAATSGDPRYVASPRVDSFHGVWFELHEELILLAGRTRADEVAAGRA